MKRGQIITGLSFLLAIFLMAAGNIPGREGFNPSDDGVILAQAFRIFQGEQPHIDFISSKPVLSGIFHSLWFHLPFPIMITGRWVVIIQFLVISLIWSLLLFRSSGSFGLKGFGNGFLFMSILLIGFLLNFGTCAIFPWTTIDALFFSSLGAWMLFSRASDCISWPGLLAGHFLFGIAVLARQSFVLLWLAAIVYSCLPLLAERNWTKAFGACMAALFPLALYFGFFLSEGQLNLVILQLTGRTEFISTAFARPVKSFLLSPIAWANGILLLGFGIVLFRRGIKRLLTRLKALRKRPWLEQAWQAYSFLSLLAAVALAFSYFLDEDKMFLRKPWNAFILLFFNLIVGVLSQKVPVPMVRIFAALLVTAWAGSVSLGANSPVFMMGSLLASILILHIPIGRAVIRQRLPDYPLQATGFLILGLFLFSAWFGQSHTNYRDLPSRDLKSDLGRILPGAKGIRTNETLYEYYEEWSGLMKQFGIKKNKWVMAPNNAAIYPLTGSRNPFPLDWLQHDEYLKAEDFLYRKMLEAIQKDTIYLFLDRYDTDLLATELKPMDYQLSGTEPGEDVFLKHYGIGKYDYLKVILPEMEKIETNSRYFYLYRSKPQRTSTDV